ncbi:MAG TPA: hypothetical protein VFG79_24150, partial [Solirubrobacter sp.]|nr:hypothetical protein [Solirubrobacter sp.]
APAAAAPVTVDLRIEGASRTLFEGPVTTDVRTFTAADGEHRCDGGAGAVTRGAVIDAASEAAPFSMVATWNPGYGNPTFAQIAGDSVAYDPATNRFLAEYKNGAFASDGSCSDAVAPGDRVLFAFADGSETLLALSGPATAKPGAAVTLKVTDAASGAPVAGASVAGAVSGADGSVSAGPWNDRGDHDLKAAKAGSIRSNRVRVCVSDGADGACGSSVPAAAAPRVVGTPPPVAAPDRAAPAALALRHGRRRLRGRFADPSGIKMVKLRLRRRAHKHCWSYSGSRERFRRDHCGRAWFFAIGDDAKWSYLLPRRLKRGRYVLDAVAIDNAGNRTPLKRRKTRVVFKLR